MPANKSLFFILTILVQFSLLACLELFGYPYFIIGIMGLCLMAGYFLMYLDNTISPVLINLGWGLRNGTLVSFVLMVVLLWWIYYR